jgi:ribose transport system ATP-binding protein
MDQYSLLMKGIVKQFPGVVALAGVDFDLKPGEVHALLGINGAGKSTLIKILAGIYQKDAGEIFFNDHKVEINNPNEAKANGITTVYQDPQMIPSYTGYENIFLGSETRTKSVFSVIQRRNLRQRAQKLLERFPFHVDLNTPVWELATVEKESIAILRALSQENMSILILDEPTSILTRSERDVLFEQIEILKSRGIAIIYITHRLDEVFQIADRFTVLRDGKNVGTYSIHDSGIDNSKITELMLGEKLNQVFPMRSGVPEEEVLRLDQLSVDGYFEGISLTACKGEILGIFGLVGSGFDELCKSIYGALPSDRGKIIIGRKEVVHRSTGDAVQNGVFLIPGDRRNEGQISDESIAFNITLSNLKEITSVAGLIQTRHERDDARRIVDALNIKTPSVRQKVALLSGGNQQKVVIGKGLYTDSSVYIFEEPTVGVDVGAKSGIYRLIRDLSKDKAVIVASSDVEEVYGISDRVMVMFKGRVVLEKPVQDTRLDEMLLYGLAGGVDGKKNQQEN